jgi:hypothetical protein
MLRACSSERPPAGRFRTSVRNHLKKFFLQKQGSSERHARERPSRATHPASSNGLARVWGTIAFLACFITAVYMHKFQTKFDAMLNLAQTSTSFKVFESCIRILRGSAIIIDEVHNYVTHTSMLRTHASGPKVNVPPTSP